MSFLLNASCVLYYNTLGKGDAALSRFIPLADGFGHGNTIRSTMQNHQNVSPFYHSQGLENCLSTRTEPCMNIWMFNRHSGERSCYP